MTSTLLKAVELSFKLGEPFDHSSPDGRECVCTVTQVRKDKSSIILQLRILFTFTGDVRDSCKIKPANPVA